MKIHNVLKGKALMLAVVMFCSTAFITPVEPLGNQTSEVLAAQETQASQETVEAQAFVPAVTGTIHSCTITSDKGNIAVRYSSTGDTTGTDGQVYVFELQPYEDGVGERKDFIGQAAAGTENTLTVALNRGTAQDRLYSSFILTVYDGTRFIEISPRHYITNPEAVASNTAEFKDPLTKKGLNIEIDMLSDAFDLGVKHVTTNIAFSQIWGTGIEYNYDGETYHFNKEVMDAYDATISALSNKGMLVTVIILNDWNPNTPNLIYPGTQKTDSAFYYMFNAATEAGFKQTRAMAAFLAEHYDGSNPDHGKVSNWIIGNEINCQIWNYMGPADISTYVRAYQRAFRMFYTAIKSTSANDRVYFSLSYNWGQPFDNQTDINYKGKDIVDYFNSIANREGQMEWGLAYHPYPAPLTEPEFWDDAQMGVITEDYNSPVINFANLNVLTDYFAQETLRTPSGHVRHIILTEQGFTSQSPTRGNVADIQAAAYAYSYYIVDSNPYIDAYTLSRQVDAPLEAKDSLNFGLWECDMSKPNLIVATKRKKIWQVFRDIDKKNSTLEATEFAKEIIGIQKWSDVIPNFKWRSMEK